MVSLAPLDRAEAIVAPSVGSSLKRKRSDEPDTTPNHPPPSHQVELPQNPSTPQTPQAKRPRVTFDPEVDVRILPDWNEKSQELVGEEVGRALERHATGDSSGYDQVRNLFEVKPTSGDAPLTGLLHKYIIALTHNVGSLNPKCRALVHTIIDCHWVSRNDRFVHSYRKFLQSLLAVQPGYTASVLKMLANLFVELPNPLMRQQDDPPIERVRMQARVHDCLKALLRQNSMLPTHLGPILAAAFPFSSEPTKSYIQYIKNLLKATEYCHDLKGEILSCIMERMVQVDVKIQNDLDEMDDDMEEDLLKQEQTEDNEEVDSSDDDSDSSEESISPEEKRSKDLQESIGKLDAMMDTLFEYYHNIFTNGDSLEIDDTFENLLSQFANLILPAHRSRHAQFLLFHFSQYSPEFIGKFAGCCSHLAFDNRNPVILRLSAAAYLASFIARGAQVSKWVVRSTFDLLCHNLERIRVEKEPKCSGPDLSRYGPYYAISQALIYTFCFRWRDLIVTEDDDPVDDELVYQGHEFVWYNGIQNILCRNIYSKLNPLRICAPAIVTQFVRVAHHLRFLYLYPLLETNKRIRLSKAVGAAFMDGVMARETALTAKKGEDSFLLDAYFPFDPYVLPRSKRWVTDEYNEWKSIPGLDPVGEDDDEESDDEDEDVKEQDGGEVESDSESDRVKVQGAVEPEFEEATDSESG